MLGAIINFCSSVGSAIGSAISGIGSALSAFANGVGAVVAGAIGALAPVAQAIGNFANAFLQGLGILKPDEKAEELGDRALQAADKGITMDKFEKFDDYMNALRDLPLDPESSAKRTHAEKLAAGIGVGTVGVESKYNAAPGSLSGMWLLPMANPEYFTPDRMQGLVTSGRLGGDIFSYLEKKLSDGESRSIEKALEVGGHGQRIGGRELDELYNALDASRSNWAKLSEQIRDNDHLKRGA